MNKFQNWKVKVQWMWIVCLNCLDSMAIFKHRWPGIWCKILKSDAIVKPSHPTKKMDTLDIYYYFQDFLVSFVVNLPFENLVNVSRNYDGNFPLSSVLESSNVTVSDFLTLFLWRKIWSKNDILKTDLYSKDMAIADDVSGLQMWKIFFKISGENRAHQILSKATCTYEVNL